VALAAEPPVHLLLAAPTNGYLEPCGCGGQVAGGLARRAQVVADLRSRQPDLLLVEMGSQGTQAEAWPLLARALGALRPAAVGLGPDDLAGAWLPAATSLPLTSLTPPLPAEQSPGAERSRSAPPPVSQILKAPGGVKVGFLSVAFGPLTTSELVAKAQAEVAKLRAAGCALWVLGSHLGATGTERLVSRLAPDDRPRVVALATSANEPAPPSDKLGATWVPVAQKGRSLSQVTLTSAGDGWAVNVTHHLLTDGPRDAMVQGWVDDYYRARQVAAQPAASATASFARPAACVACHEPQVKAWRGHAHARAVDTLAGKGRLVPECLRCHDERQRRDHQPSGPGDRGVECASCHDTPPAHLERKASATRPSLATCTACHNPEHSPRFQPDAAWAAVRDLCRAKR